VERFEKVEKGVASLPQHHKTNSFKLIDSNSRRNGRLKKWLYRGMGLRAREFAQEEGITKAIEKCFFRLNCQVRIRHSDQNKH